MQLEHERCECALCGELFDMPTDALPQPMIEPASGSASFRALYVLGEVVHRCEMRDSAASSPTEQADAASPRSRRY